MAYISLTPIEEKPKTRDSTIPEAYTPLYQQPKEYVKALQDKINEDIGNVGDLDAPSESDIKDIWDNFYLGMRNVLHKTKNYFINTLPNIVFKDIKPGDTIPFTGEVVTKEHAEKVNERNQKLRGEFKKAYNKSEQQYQEWLDKNPQIQPPKGRPEWNRPALDAIKDNPKLLFDPSYLAFKAAGSASFTLGVMGTTLAVGAATGNPVLALGAGVAVATPLVSQDLFEDLVANGATEEQAADLTKYIAPIIASVEVAGDLPLLKQLGGKIFSRALTTNIRKEVAKRTMSYITKKGFVKFAQVELAETMEEVLQQAIQDATVKTVNKNRVILKDASNLITETLIATLPFGLVGGTSAVQQEIKEAKAEPKPEMKLEEPSVQEIAIEPRIEPEPEIEPEKVVAKEKPIKELTAEEIHDMVIRIIPRDVTRITSDLIEAKLVSELLDKNVSVRQSKVIAENVAPDAVAVFKEGEGTEIKRLEELAQTLENELSIGISEIKPEIKSKIKAIPKELEPLTEEARKFKTAKGFVKSIHNKFGKDAQIIDTDKLELFETAIDRKLVDKLKKRIKSGDDSVFLHTDRIDKAPAIRIDTFEIPKKAGKFRVVDGNHRLLAAKELGLKNVPVEIKGFGDTEISLSIFYNRAIKEIKKEKPTLVKKKKEVKPVPFEKEGRNLMEWENEDLTLPELKKKLEIAIEGKEDIDLIDELKSEIRKRTIKEKPKGKPAKVAISIEAKAKEKGIVEIFEELAEFTPVVIKEQVAKIEKLMEDNIERAKAMAIGEEPLDKDIKGAILVKMIEDYAMENQDGELILALANSPLVSETSIAGQTLRLIRERVQDSATQKIKEVEAERKKVAKKKLKGKTVKQAKGDIKKDLEGKLETESKKISKHSWEALINEIIC